MANVGERVALNREMLDTEGGVAHANEVGLVFGHMGNRPLVELDHGETYLGDKRVVLCDPGDIRVVRVAHPGKARRSKPRRSDEVD